MVFSTKEFKEVCSTILSAIDSNEISTLTETLELKTEGKKLFLNVTNGEYFASVTFDLDHEEDFRASVNANLFLKLISAVTTDTISLEVKDNYVQMKANGSYKIPLIFEDSKLLALPEINIENVTCSMKISGDILESILNYNSKELLRGTISKPVQKMYYVDETGCITFTTGACVNKFTLEKPIKILFNNRLVKLFKLFKNQMVDFDLGYDAVSESIIQTKVKLSTANISLTAITGCDDQLINSVPVNAIRNRAEAEYEHNVVLSKEELSQAINRLLLFSAGYGGSKNLKPYSLFKCSNDCFMVYDSGKDNVEKVMFKNDTSVSDEYEMLLDLSDLKMVLDTITEEYVTMSFGNHSAIVLKRGSIYNVIPECRSAQ